jgi:hypothetical protein
MALMLSSFAHFLPAAGCGGGEKMAGHPTSWNTIAVTVRRKILQVSGGPWITFMAPGSEMHDQGHAL